MQRKKRGLRSLRIAGVDVKVVEEHTIKDPDNESREVMGLAEYPQGIIRIALYDGRGDISEANRDTALIHEILHIIDDRYTIGLKEKQITVLANALYAFIADNFDIELIKFICPRDSTGHAGLPDAPA